MACNTREESAAELARETERRYYIKDCQTGAIVSKRGYPTARAAHRAADRLDLAYGAVRYVVFLA